MLTLLLALQVQNPLAQVVDPIRTHQNILHYEFTIDIPDTGNALSAIATVHYRVEQSDHALVLDLDHAMRVHHVWAGDQEPAFRHDGDTLVIEHWGAVGDSLTVTIAYGGRPTDGLFIQNNDYGQRTAFADDWPNRARYWLPTEDHPSDKASVSWTIEIPATWRAIANGHLVDTVRLTSGRIRWRYHEPRRIPAYTYVIGAGELAVTPLISQGGVRQSLWTFPEDSAFAVTGPFRRVNEMVDVYTDLVGAFPYRKLAHVESNTRFGGMENSGAIFYTQRGYVNRTMGEPLVAHETAHQWFGDAVTEHDWHHIWLSEGFASYLDPLFWELTGDLEQFGQRMQEAKERYLKSDVIDRPILDFEVTDPWELLNENSYPKGAWVLHMLRHQIGDDAFFAGLREFYLTYRDSTALSQDFREVIERVSTQDLGWFFAQWLTQPGYPQLEVTLRRSVGPSVRRDGEAVVVLEQVQPEAWGLFRIPVRVDVINSATGERASTVLVMRRRRSEVTLQIPRGADAIEVDPDGDLLLTAKAEWAGR